MVPDSEPRQRRRSRRRLIGWIGGGGAGLVLLALLTVPLWAPWGARPLAAHWGVRLGRITRAGYWRLRISEARWEGAGQSLRCGEVVLLQPLGWVVERWFPGALTGPTAPAVVVRDWQFTRPAGAAATGTAGPRSSAAALDEAVAAWRQLTPWLRHARAERGRARWAGRTLRLPWAVWTRGTLAVRVKDAARGETARITLERRRGDRLTVVVRHRWGGLRTTMRRAADHGWAFRGEARTAGGAGRWEGVFGPTGWWPKTADLTLRLGRPAAAARPAWLPRVEGRLTARCAGAAVRVAARVTGRLEPPGRTAQDFQGRLAGVFDAETCELRALEWRMPALTAGLRAPWRVRWADWFSGRRVRPLRLRVQARLAGLAGPAVTGEINGEVDIGPGGTPVTVHWRTLPAERNEARVAGRTFSLAAEGRLRGAELEIRRFRLARRVPSPAPASAAAAAPPEQTLRLTGRVNLARGELAGAWELRSRTFRRRTTNSPPVVVTVTGGGNIAGPWRQPRHSGECAVAVRRPASRESRPLTARLTWTGTGKTITRWEGRLRGAWEGELAGRAEVASAGRPLVTVELERAAARRAGRTVLRLAAPARFTLDREIGGAAGGAGASAPGWCLGLTPLRLTGPGRELTLAGETRWPRRGWLRVSARGPGGADAPTLPVPGTGSVPVRVAVERLRLTAGWTNGPVAFALEGRVHASSARARLPRFAVNIRAQGAGGTARLDALELARGGKVFARAAGVIPWGLWPAAAPGRRARHSAAHPWRLTLTADPKGPEWRELERRWGVEVEAPRLRLTLTGTEAAPEGRCDFQAARVSSSRTWHGVALPSLDRPRLRARFAPGAPWGVEAEASVLGQSGRLTATLPWNPVRSPRPDWSRCAARLRLADWDVSGLASLAKGVLRPRGRLDADVTLAPGFRWAGRLRLSGLSTRPLEPLGAARDGEAEIRLEPDGLRLERARAELSGQPVVARGFWRWSGPGAPAFRLTLGGTNLAFLRQADLFLRGDVALELAGTRLTDGRVTGAVTLRDSLLLRDLRSLVSGGIEQPETRPPFFSVSRAPFGDWKLDVRVAGDRFLRVITPVFKGRVSAALQLTGTLREPMILGDVTVPEGQALFPFGYLRVEQGRITLSRSAPFQPQLAFHATGQNFGYQVRMEVSGPADAPAIFFSSVPPLTSTQILLMLTSGDIPGGAFSYSSRGRLQDIGIFLGKEFLGRLTGNPGDDRLRMRAGEEITDRGQLTYSIEYRLSPRWSVFGMKDRFDNYGGGLKWRVFSQ